MSKVQIPDFNFDDDTWHTIEQISDQGDDSLLEILKDLTEPDISISSILHDQNNDDDDRPDNDMQNNLDHTDDDMPAMPQPPDDNDDDLRPGGSSSSGRPA